MSQSQQVPPVTPNGDDPIPLLIDNNPVTSPETFPVISPTTSSTVWNCVSSSPSLALRAVHSSTAAFLSWRATTPTTRRAILLKAADILESRISQGAALMCKETGTDLGAAQGFILPTALAMLRDIAGQIDGVCGRIVSTAAGEGECGCGMVLKEAIGVVLGIVAWNAPPVFTIRAAATAIAAGCTTIIKSSEHAPASVNFIARAFYDAGLPPGVLNIIHTRRADAAEIVSIIVEQPSLRKVNFTGSSAVGRQIAGLCGRLLKPCVMELGGKNSAIVCEDAEIDGGETDVIGEVVRGFSLNSGQICMATDRILVHESIAEEFTARLKSAIEEANSKSHPTVVSTASKQRLVKLIREAVEMGATLVTGLDLANIQEETNATMPITLLSDVPAAAARAATEEFFGPVAFVERFTSTERAIEVANSANANSSLSCAIFTGDLRKGLRMARQINTGAVHINSMSIHDDPTMPHGGVGESGWGRFNAREGLEEFLVSKGITWRE